MSARRPGILILLTCLVTMACKAAKEPPHNGVVLYDDSVNPDTVFKEYLTGNNLYWNKPPRGARYLDYSEYETYCTTSELVCMEYPFPVVVPRRVGETGKQAIKEGSLTYYAYAPPQSDAALVCDLDRFTVITVFLFDEHEEIWRFQFSRLNGLEQAARVAWNEYGDPVVTHFFGRVSGRVLTHEEICR